MSNFSRAEMSAMPRVRVWDLPIRAVHWSLATLVLGEYVTQAIGGAAMVWHSRLGIAIFGLLIFRIAWGFIGSSPARFAEFVKGPGAIRAYLKGHWRGVGHNPLGALSVLALLGTIAILALTGLVANDEISTQGPLYALISERFSDLATTIHKSMKPVLIAIVTLHITAIAFYVRIKRENVLLPMLNGWKETDVKVTAGGPLALAIALTISVALTVAVSGAFLNEAVASAPSSSSPSW